MAQAATKAGVGPMAAVAGVLADLAVEDMIKAGASVAVVENGGEASIASDRSLDVALLAGNHPVSGRFVFKLNHFPAGIATSSAVFSHALSFGDAEAVTIFSSNAGLADAAATAVCNQTRGSDHKTAARRAAEFALSIDGVHGVLVVCGNIVARAGHLPDIAEIRTPESASKESNWSQGRLPTSSLKGHHPRASLSQNPV